MPPYEHERFIIVNCIFNSCVFRRSDFLKTKGYDAGLIYGYEDWDLLLQLISRGDKVIQLDEMVYLYRQHEVSRNDFNKNEKELNITLKYLYKKHYKHYKGAGLFKLPYFAFVDNRYTYQEKDLIKNHTKLIIAYYWNHFFKDKMKLDFLLYK